MNNKKYINQRKLSRQIIIPKNLVENSTDFHDHDIIKNCVVEFSFDITIN